MTILARIASAHKGHVGTAASAVPPSEARRMGADAAGFFLTYWDFPFWQAALLAAISAIALARHPRAS